MPVKFSSQPAWPASDAGSEPSQDEGRGALPAPPALTAAQIEAGLPLLDLVADGLVIVDSSTRIVAFNQAMVEITGVPRDEALGQPCARVLECHTLDGEPCDHALGPSTRTTFTDGSGRCRTLILQRADGERRCLQVRCRPANDDQGRAAYVVGTVRDVTGEEKLHQQQLRARSICGLDQVVSEFADRIRDPLHGIDVQVQLLGRLVGSATRGPGEVRQVVRTVRDEIQRVTSALASAFEKNRKGRRKQVDVTSVLLRLGQLLAPRAEAQGITVIVDVQDGLPPAYLDPENISRALLMVAINAIEAMPDGGILRFLAYQDRGALRLAVSDTGVGVPPALRDRIFRLGVTSKPGATGAGLTMAASLAAEEGGTLQLTEDSTRVGSEFVLTLPHA